MHCDFCMQTDRKGESDGAFHLAGDVVHLKIKYNGREKYGPRQERGEVFVLWRDILSEANQGLLDTKFVLHVPFVI